MKKMFSVLACFAALSLFLEFTSSVNAAPTLTQALSEVQQLEQKIQGLTKQVTDLDVKLTKANDDANAKSLEIADKANAKSLELADKAVSLSGEFSGWVNNFIAKIALVLGVIALIFGGSFVALFLSMKFKFEKHSLDLQSKLTGEFETQFSKYREKIGLLTSELENVQKLLYVERQSREEVVHYWKPECVDLDSRNAFAILQDYKINCAKVDDSASIATLSGDILFLDLWHFSNAAADQKVKAFIDHAVALVGKTTPLIVLTKPGPPVITNMAPMQTFANSTLTGLTNLLAASRVAAMLKWQGLSR
jgi:cell division protein FtsL